MRILLIAPATGPWRGLARRRLFNGRAFRFSMLSLLTVAALTPDEDTVRIVDEQIEPVPADEAFDLVGITAMTAAAPRAYELAAGFRRRGIPVVLGGYHATLNPDEAIRFVDAVVVGPAAGAWEACVSDARAGRLGGHYCGHADVPAPPRLPRELLGRRGYLTVNATHATTGCRNRCRFCSITRFYEGRRHHRPVNEVAAEVASFHERFFILVDDNLTQDRDHTRRLLQALAPLGKRWVTQVSIDAADDPELLALLARAGCRGVFVGLETFDRDALAAQGKDGNAPERYRAAVRRFHDHGLFVEAGIIFGHDRDRPTVFRRTLRMLERIGIDAIQVSILTPLPGTPLHDDLAPRIFDHDHEHYDYRHVVFEPAGMSRVELQSGADWVIRSFYSPWRIARRLTRWLRLPVGPRSVGYALGLNLAYLGRVRRFRIRGADPARGSAQRTVMPMVLPS